MQEDFIWEGSLGVSWFNVFDKHFTQFMENFSWGQRDLATLIFQIKLC